MDFIEGLPKLGTKDVILVVVDRLAKYAQFIALSLTHSQHNQWHSALVAIVTDRDKIFTSKLWQEIFKSLKVSAF
jgi:hypothetical protein